MSKLETALLTIAIAIAAPVGNALLTLNDSTFTDPMPWVRALIIGLAVALGALLFKWSQAHGPVITIAPREAPLDPALAPTPEYTTTVSAMANPEANISVSYLPPTLPDHSGTLPRPEAAQPNSAGPTS